MEQVIQIDEENKTPLSVHGINKIKTTQSGFTFNAPLSTPSGFTNCFKQNTTQMYGDMKVERHPETGQPINHMPFQFGITHDRKKHIENLYNELNNMRNSIDKCNKTLDTMWYESSQKDLVHVEYNNLREYYNNITKSIDKFYETLRFIN
jgi:hypothetical protein